MIDRKWMKDNAFEVKKCPGCGQQSFCLIFEHVTVGQEWECADTDCGYKLTKKLTNSKSKELKTG